MKSLIALSGFLLLGIFQTSPWPHRRAVEGTLPPAGDFAAVELDTTLYKEAQPNLRDLRLVDGASQEVPYQIITLSPRKVFQMVKAKVVKQTPTAQGYEHLLDLDEKDLPHGKITLKAKVSSFERNLRIWGSEDGQVWKELNQWSLSPLEGVQSREQKYYTTTARYLKITETVEGGKFKVPPIEIVEAAVEAEKTVPGEALFFDIQILSQKEVQNASQKTTQWDLDLGSEHLPLNGLELKIEKEKFSRYVKVESSIDGQEWRFVNSATLTAPSKEHPFPYQRLSFSTSRDFLRYLRLNIEHGDDVPLPVTEIKGYQWRQWLVFKRQGSGPYFVYFGKPGASAPQYDWQPFSEIEKQLPSLTKMSLGPTQPNADYKKPLVTPRLFFILALVFVTVVLGILILSLLRRAPKV